MTNETIETLKKRRSCKDFLPEQIRDEELEAVLEAGKYAPTGRGLQSPIMIAVQNPETVKKLSKMNARVMGTDADPFYGAPTVVVVLAEKGSHTRVYDGSLVMGNMLNAAYSLGLGCCWIHRAKEMFESEEGKALLKEWEVTGEYEGIGNCVLGYAASDPHPEKPRKPDYVRIIKLRRRI